MCVGNEDCYSSLSTTSMVHVDDVARAHIFLLEHPDVKGRFNCSSDFMTLERMAEFLSDKYPEFHIPSKEWASQIALENFTTIIYQPTSDDVEICY